MNPEPKTSAQLCRENGWGVGTVLETPGYYDGPGYRPGARLLITAVGEATLLARGIAISGVDGRWADRLDIEREYSLAGRTWKAVAAEPAAGGEEGEEAPRIFLRLKGTDESLFQPAEPILVGPFRELRFKFGDHVYDQDGKPVFRFQWWSSDPDSLEIVNGAPIVGGGGNKDDAGPSEGDIRHIEIFAIPPAGPAQPAGRDANKVLLEMEACAAAAEARGRQAKADRDKLARLIDRVYASGCEFLPDYPEAISENLDAAFEAARPFLEAQEEGAE